MAFNTGNAIGSTDPRDLSDNSENLDNAVNDLASPTWVDRFGNSRTTLAGQIGYIGTGVDGAIETYTSGLELTTYSTIIEYNGEFYRPSASATLPYTTTATLPDADSNLVAVGDAVLRQDLAGSLSGEGASLVSMEGGPTVEVAVNNRVIRVSSRTEMKAYDVPAGYQFSLEEGGRSGLFVRRAGSPPFSDPGEGVYVVADAGGYDERIESEVLSLEMFGVIADSNGTTGSGTDNTVALQNLNTFLQNEPNVKLTSSGGIARFIHPGAGSELFSLSDKNGIVLDLGDLTLFDDKSYDLGANEVGELFSIRRSSNISGKVNVKATVHISTSTFTDTEGGLQTFRMREGCENIDLSINQEGGGRCILFTRGFADPEANRCKNINLLVNSLNVDEPVTGTNSGDNLTAVVRNEGGGRPFFFWDVKNINLYYLNRNHQKNPYLVAPLSGVEVKITDDNSDQFRGSAALLELGWRDEDIYANLAPEMNNIDIEINYNNDGSTGGTLNTLLLLTKREAGGDLPGGFTTQDIGALCRGFNAKIYYNFTEIPFALIDNNGGGVFNSAETAQDINFTINGVGQTSTGASAFFFSTADNSINLNDCKTNGVNNSIVVKGKALVKNSSISASVDNGDPYEQVYINSEIETSKTAPITDLATKVMINSTVGQSVDVGERYTLPQIVYDKVFAIGAGATVTTGLIVPADRGTYRITIDGAFIDGGSNVLISVPSIIYLYVTPDAESTVNVSGSEFSVAVNAGTRKLEVTSSAPGGRNPRVVVERL